MSIISSVCSGSTVCSYLNSVSSFAKESAMNHPILTATVFLTGLSCLGNLKEYKRIKNFQKDPSLGSYALAVPPANFQQQLVVSNLSDEEVDFIQNTAHFTNKKVNGEVVSFEFMHDKVTLNIVRGPKKVFKLGNEVDGRLMLTINENRVDYCRCKVIQEGLDKNSSNLLNKTFDVDGGTKRLRRRVGRLGDKEVKLYWNGRSLQERKRSLIADGIVGGAILGCILSTVVYGVCCIGQALFGKK